MKKLLAIVLASVCVLSFSACGGNQNNSLESSTTTSTTTTTTTIEPTTTTTTTTSTTTTTKKKTTTTKKKTTTTTTTAKPETNTVIFENNGIKITYKGLDFDSSYLGPEIKLLIENYSNKPYTVQVRDFAIDGYMIDTSCSADVTPGNKINDGISIRKRSLEENGLNQYSIKNAQFYFQIFNSDDWSDSFDTVVINLKL